MSTNGEYKQSFDPESTSRSWLIFADDKIVGQIAQKHTHTHLFLRTSHSFRGGTYIYLGTHTTHTSLFFKSVFTTDVSIVIAIKRA